MRQNNREAILQTARKLFLLHGYNGVSIRTIASEANLTTGAVYFHFKNKKEIYKTICLEAIDILLARFKMGMESRETPQQKLISTYDSYISFYIDNHDYYRLLMEYKTDYGSDEEEKNEVAIKMQELMDLMAENIKKGIKDGIFRDVDPIKVSVILASVAEGMLHYKNLGIFETTNISDKDFRDSMADLIGNGIIQKS